MSDTDSVYGCNRLWGPAVPVAPEPCAPVSRLRVSFSEQECVLQAFIQASGVGARPGRGRAGRRKTNHGGTVHTTQQSSIEDLADRTITANSRGGLARALVHISYLTRKQSSGAPLGMSCTLPDAHAASPAPCRGLGSQPARARRGGVRLTQPRTDLAALCRAYHTPRASSLSQ